MMPFKGETKMENKFAKQFETLVEDNDLKLYKMENEVGISRSTLSRWKLGETMPNAEQIFILCKQYNVTPNWILGWL